MPFNPVIIVAKGEKPPWYKNTSQYLQRDVRTALRQLFTTLIPYFLLLALMAQTVRHGYPYGVTLALAVIAAALLTRIFIFFHDCTHGSLLPSPRWNRNIGYLCGILVFTAFHDWRRSHAGHHITAGDLDRRGMGDIDTMTVDEYRSAPPLRRLGYRFYRHPLVLLGVGPLYYFLLRNRYQSRGAKKIDFVSVIVTNLTLAAIIVAASLTIGFRTYLLVQLPVLMVGATIGVWLFYIQHRLKGSTGLATRNGTPGRSSCQGLPITNCRNSCSGLRAISGFVTSTTCDPAFQIIVCRNATRERRNSRSSNHLLYAMSL